MLFIQHNSRLAITDQAITGLVSDNTRWTGVSRHRAGSAFWEFVEIDGGKAFYLDKLPEPTLRKIETKYGDLDIAARLATLGGFAERRILPEDASFFHSQFENFSPKQIDGLSAACGWLRMVVDREGSAPYPTAGAYFDAVAECLASLNLYGLNVSSAQVLRRRERRWRKEGRDSLISKKHGNSNRCTVSERGIKRLVELYSCPLKPTIRKTWKTWCEEALREDYGEMSEPRAGQILRMAEHKAVWYGPRHGQHATDEEYKSATKRRKPSYPDALWDFDGTAVQLYYRDKKGKVRGDLYWVLVHDNYSTAVLGFAVGKTETSHLVQAALRNACRFGGCQPTQVLYDNASANKSKQTQELLTRLARRGWPAAPYNGREKPIESLIGRIEQGYLRYHPAFKGSNVTSSSLHGKANPDFIAAFAKTDKVPLEHEIEGLLQQSIEQYNNTPNLRDGKTPAERYAKQDERRIQASVSTLADLFWVQHSRPCKYKRDGIEVTISKEKRTYWVNPENADPSDLSKPLLEDIDFRINHIGDRFDIRYDPKQPERIALYKNGAFVSLAHQRRDVAMTAEETTEFDSVQRRAETAQREAFKRRTEETYEGLRVLSENEGLPKPEEVFNPYLKKDSYNAAQVAIEDDIIIKTARPNKRTLHEPDDGHKLRVVD